MAYGKNQCSHTPMSLWVDWGSVALGWEAAVLLEFDSRPAHVYLVLLGLVTAQGMVSQ